MGLLRLSYGVSIAMWELKYLGMHLNHCYAMDWRHVGQLATPEVDRCITIEIKF